MRFSKLVPLALLWVVAADTAISGTPDDPRFEAVGQRIDFFRSAAVSGFALGDFDGDGREDAAFLAWAGNEYALYVVGRASDGVFEIKSTQRVPVDGGSARITTAPGPDGTSRVVTVGADGPVRFYGGWPLAEITNWNAAPLARWAEIGDVDGDGQAELIVLTVDRLLRYDIGSGALTGAHPLTGYFRMTLAQLDADPALEIILGTNAPWTGGRGLVLDGATFATDWDYIDPFGEMLVAGRFGSGQDTLWFGTPGSAVYTLYRSNPWSPLWSEKVWNQIAATAAADVEGLNRDVLLLGVANTVEAIDPRSQQSIATATSSSGSTLRITGADVEGEGRDQIIFTSDAREEMPQVTLADGMSGQTLWQFSAPRGPFGPTALGDVDADGNVELITAGAHSWSTSSTLAIFDARSGRERWRRSPQFSTDDPFYTKANDVQLVPRQGSPGMDVIFAGEMNGSGRFAVIDGVTMQPRLMVGYQFGGTPIMSSRPIWAMTVLDYDGDGTVDYAAITAQGWNTPGAKVFVFSGVNGELLWESPVFGNAASTVRGAFVATRKDGSTELVVSLDDGLRAFQAPTGLVSWTLPSTSEGAALIPLGIDGQEILTFSANGQVSVFDYETRAPLRSFSLPSPLRAVSALNGDATRLVAAASGRLQLADGTDGHIVATTAPFDAMSRSMKPLGLLARSPTSALVAVGADSALAWFRLDLTDRLFESGFE